SDPARGAGALGGDCSGRDRLPAPAPGPALRLRDPRTPRRRGAGRCAGAGTLRRPQRRWVHRRPARFERAAGHQTPPAGGGRTARPHPRGARAVYADRSGIRRGTCRRVAPGDPAPARGYRGASARPGAGRGADPAAALGPGVGALPPRRAATEERGLGQEPAAPPTPQPPSGQAWEPYRAGNAFLRRLGAGGSPRAVWSALPTPAGEDPQEWARAICAAAQATLASGRGVLVLVPTVEDLAAVRSAFEAAAIDVVELTAELGPAARYENFLTCLLGRRRVVVGTRAAAYAPVDNLGLLVCWDEVHDAYSEPRAPYPHARETLVRRATLAGAGALIG